MNQVTVLYCIVLYNFYMLYIAGQKDIKNYKYIIFTKHYSFPIITHFLKKKEEKHLYFRT